MLVSDMMAVLAAMAASTQLAREKRKEKKKKMKMKSQCPKNEHHELGASCNAALHIACTALP
jgi:hypothetical protein